jgi:hypothetical protein
MAKLEWTEVKDRFIAVPKEGVVVTACKVGNSSSWAILIDGARKKHGVCRDLESAKRAASSEVDTYLRG